MADVIIVGAGPAGLSAALVLGRCRRDVIVIDSEQPRNAKSRAVNNYLTRDHTPPAKMRAAGMEEVLGYGVKVIRGRVKHAEKLADGCFMVRTAGEMDASGSRRLGEEYVGRKLLLATGVRDILPDIPGFADFYGSSIHHCPYCDGWEHRGERLVAFGEGDAAIGLALALRTWSDRVTACTHGTKPSEELRVRATRRGIVVCEAPVTELRGQGDCLRSVELADKGSIQCEAMFFNTGQAQRSQLPALLGCEFKDDGGVRTSDRQCTGIEGLYAAGDADKEVQFVIVAAAEGATAAVAINRELQEEAG